MIVRSLPGAARWFVAALLGLASGLPTERADAAEDVPLPLTGRVTVRAIGKRYVIDGKQTIPPGSVIRVEANVHIAGINNASLDVRGGLQVHGISGSLVEISNVDFSPTVAPDGEVHFDMATLSGFQMNHPEGAAFEGQMTLENCTVGSGGFAVKIKSGYVRLMSVKWSGPCSIDSVAGKGGRPEISVRNCTLSDLSISGASNGTVRDSELTGIFRATGFTDLLVDRCDLTGGMAFSQEADGTFSGLRLMSCNLLPGAHISLQRPKGPKTSMEKVRIQKFWFGKANGQADLTDKEVAARIEDGEDDENLSVKAFVQDPTKNRQ